MLADRPDVLRRLAAGLGLRRLPVLWGLLSPSDASVMSWRPPARWPSAFERQAPGASTGSTQHPRQRAYARMTAQVLQPDREPAAPVRMLVDGAREVGLVRHAERVLDRNHQNPAGRGGEIARDRQEARAGPLLASMPRERRAQRSLGRRAIRIGLAGVDAERAFFPQVTTYRPTRERRKIVRAERDQRVLGITFRRPKPAILVPFEQHHPVGPHTPIGERFPQMFRHGAEVL